MASRKALLLIFFLVLSSVFPSLDARKLLEMKEDEKKSIPAALAASLVLGALPKGTVPASAPSKKGHDMIVDEKLIARHLAAVDRILRSVPSPGVGH